MAVGSCVALVMMLAGLIASPVAGATLPDGRAYELVSPPVKNGGDVLADSQRTRASVDGDAVSFSSLTGFGDAAGTGVATEYMAIRSGAANPESNGWTTHGITAKQDPVSIKGAFSGLEPMFVGEFAPDLTKGIFRAWSPLTADGDVSQVVNMYARADLRSSGAGSYGLLTGCPLCALTHTPLSLPLFLPSRAFPFLDWASADFEHVLFESTLNLTPDASGIFSKVYESDDGVVHLASILPDGTSATNAVAGEGAGINGGGYASHTISADGSRVFFTVPASSGAVPINGQAGDLYMRVNGAETVQLNASERTDCADHDPCTGAPEADPNGPAPAQYWDANLDGSRIFLSTTEALTDDAPSGGTGKLYMYDASKPASSPNNLHLLSVDHELGDTGNVDPNTSGVIGVSDDGRYVYFTAIGQLVAGKPIVNAGIYMWHDDGSENGTEAYVGEQANVGDAAELLLNRDPQVVGFQGRVTPDGRHLLFSATSGVGLLSQNGSGATDYDHGACMLNNLGAQCRELYVYSADTGRLQCASCNPSGVAAVGDASDVARANSGAAKSAWHLSHAISDDGKRVFFNSPDALVLGDGNGKIDAYEYDVPSGTVHLLSSGHDSSDSYFLDASASGDDAFFITRERLVGWDTDQNYDLYDAREPHAGHPAGFPDPPANPACQGEGCHGPAQSAPGAVSATGSESFLSGGNVPNPPHHTAKPKPKKKKLTCRRGFVRKKVHSKVKCVKVKRARPKAAIRSRSTRKGR